MGVNMVEQYRKMLIELCAAIRKCDNDVLDYTPGLWAAIRKAEELIEDEENI
jgi:hypothetical protein